MNKPKYIKKIEKDGEILSIMNLLSLPKEFEKYADGLKTTLVHSVVDVDYVDGIPKYCEKIYKTSQGFYLYLSLSKSGDHVGLTIYYKQEQLNELSIFVRGLLKQFKNATTDIRGNQTKN
jgi:hypothetical protein